MAIPTRIPEAFYASETVRFLLDLPDHRPADGWSVEARIVSTVGSIAGVSSDYGDGRHLVTFDSAVTASIAIGDHRLICAAVKAGERFVVSARDVRVLPDPATAADFRSAVKKALDAIEAYMADPNNLQAASFSIAGRSLDRYKAGELIALHGYYLRQYRREQEAMDRLSGRRPRRRLLVRSHA